MSPSQARAPKHVRRSEILLEVDTLVEEIKHPIMIGVLRVDSIPIWCLIAAAGKWTTWKIFSGQAV